MTVCDNQSARSGTALCLAAALGFSTVAIFTKLAYRAGVETGTLLVVRSAIATLLFWLILAVRRSPLPDATPAKQGLLLGIVGSSMQSWLLAGAVARIDAALAAMLFYSYPMLVMVGAITIGRERATYRNAVALVASGAGVLLVLSASSLNIRLEVGVILALGSALAFAGSLLAGHHLLERISPLTLATLVSTGASLTYIGVFGLSDNITFAFQPWGWLPLVGLAVVSSVMASGASYAGLQRVGPTRASVIMMSELPMTVVMAMIIFGEHLFMIQLLGGLFILMAIPIVKRSQAGDSPA